MNSSSLAASAFRLNSGFAAKIQEYINYEKLHFYFAIRKDSFTKHVTKTKIDKSVNTAANEYFRKLKIKQINTKNTNTCLINLL